MAEIAFGTCGWSYAEWEGIFYPEKSGKLSQYCKIFSTAEIDSTFYALPNEGTVRGWATRTPSGFMFSAKLPQTITHKKALELNRGIESDLNQFIETMHPLIEAGKLSVILAQLPPSLEFDSEKLESFFSILPKQVHFAVEFRNNSWLRNETFKILENYNVSFTIVDEPLLPPDVHVTSDIAYIRWHGRGSQPWFNYKYSEQELEAWVPKVKEAASKSKKVLGYFNNHFHGYAPENALQTMQMLGIVTPHATAALQRLTFQRKYSGKGKTEIGTLDSWTGEVGDRIRGLSNYASPEVIEAARGISDDDFSLREKTKHRLAAYVGNTTVDIDLDSRTIIHRCSIWDKLSSQKKFCKHIVKLILSIDPNEATRLLSTLNSSLDEWKFESRLQVDTSR
ncbi:MAG TPA: DUF72 domain-containing protein [Candidatus Bathyarchaeia archaeon]|nr:DUF72 domain-containing protein [Candidatus Bathyarchaeia archaeon]